MRKLNRILLLFSFVFFTAFTFAQTSVNGTVTADDGTALPGVTVMVKGTTVGTVSDANGKYKIEAPAGAQFLVFSYVGMATQEVAVKAGTVNVTLSPENAELVEIFVVADRAKERETPVAFSDVSKKDIEQQLGSRDLPLVMNMTPSVYSTAGGGGAGDARINVRGFNQRNVAIMINGVPVNDMENGWVYWSNWDGVADATSSIQMQRGLSAVNLATPSIGGTMNIITSPADKKSGGIAKMEYGSGNFMKMTLTGNTGMINDKFALSASLVGKQGAGVIDGTWTKAFAYYLGTTYKVNKSHKLELFVVGAAQRHGQNLYKQNVAAYSHEYAKELGADDSTLLKFPEADASVIYPGYSDAKAGRFYNENWSPITANYNGNQFWNGKEHSRFSKDFINERENFYHKPLANLNWYATWSPKVKQYTTLYYSGGTGGGSGTYGSMRWNYNAGIYDSPSRFVSWDETYNNNTASDTAFGILRNSVNNQWTIGAISRAQILFTDHFKAQVGIDWRKAKIDHFREVRDLVGGKFFYYNGNEFDSSSDYNKVLGDKIVYNFTNTVDWIGYFAQAEYNTDKFTAYGTFGHSFIKYTYTNHFKKATDGTSELYAETKYMPGYQLKGGLSYRPIGGFSIFGNYGYISKAPIFDNVIDDYSAAIADDPKNEIFNAWEIGVNYETPQKDLSIKVNYYNTEWTDRAISRGVLTDAGTDAIVFLTGMGESHKGFEFETFYKPIKFVELGAIASFGNWTYLNDVSGTYREYNGSSYVTEEYNYYIKDLKVGDSPQTQFGGKLTLLPISGLRLQFDARYYNNHYADFDPTTRTDETDIEQVWLTPAYFLADMHFSYQLPLKGKFGVEVYAHVFNLLDAMYIQDAVDNSKYNSFTGYDNRFTHTVNSAEVYLGLPRTFNAGVVLTF